MNIEKYNAGKLWNKYHKAIYNMIAHNISDREVAMQVFQQTYINIHKGNEVVSSSSNPETGIYQIAKETLLEQIQDNGKYPFSNMGYMEISCCLIPYLETKSIGDQVLFLQNQLDEKTRVEFINRLNVFLLGSKTKMKSLILKLKDVLEEKPSEQPTEIH